MKCSININQKNIIDNNLDLDIIEASILDYLISFVSFKDIVKYNIDWEQYFEVNYEILINEMPLLKLTKQRLKTITNELNDKGFLFKKVVNNNTTCFKLTDLSMLLISEGGVGWKWTGGLVENHQGGWLKNIKGVGWKSSTPPEEIERLFNWRNKYQTLPTCQKITPDIIDEYNKLIKKWYTIDDMSKALANYLREIKNRKPTCWDYLKHRFSLYIFLKQENWFKKFLYYN